MRTVCEVVVKDILPATRALIAKELLESHKLTQQEAAQKMGVTQPAISQYKRDLRGYKVKILEGNDETIHYIKKLALDVAEGDVDVHQLTNEYYTILDIVITEGLLHKIDDKIDHPLERCKACESN